jgi:hypothetical protein
LEFFKPAWSSHLDHEKTLCSNNKQI